MVFHNQVVALHFPEDVCIALDNLKSVTVIGGGRIKICNSFHHNKVKMNITKFSLVFTLKKEQRGHQVALI